VFCQNWDISHDGEGVEVRADELAAIMLELQSRGCHNINFVTPEHVVPQVLESLWLAAEAGLRIPLVYNTSAYDSARSLDLLDGVVDIYMPDFKCWNPELARRHLKAADYPVVARRVIAEMHRQVGPLSFDRHGVAVRGVLVRHLVMPGGAEDSRQIFRYLAHDVSADTYVNIMAQYHPAGSVNAKKFPELCRRPTADELQLVEEYARAEGLWRFDHR
jgi:putative pyruvate formate lyase activating enzyme